MKTFFSSDFIFQKTRKKKLFSYDIQTIPVKISKVPPQFPNWSPEIHWAVIIQLHIKAHANSVQCETESHVRGVPSAYSEVPLKSHSPISPTYIRLERPKQLLFPSGRLLSLGLSSLLTSTSFFLIFLLSSNQFCLSKQIYASLFMVFHCFLRIYVSALS